MEVDSLDLIAEYVARGFGVGIGVAIPGEPERRGVRAIRLRGFPPLVVAVLHLGALKPVAEEFLAMAKGLARKLSGGRRTR